VLKIPDAESVRPRYCRSRGAVGTERGGVWGRRLGAMAPPQKIFQNVPI